MAGYDYIKFEAKFMFQNFLKVLANKIYEYLWEFYILSFSYTHLRKRGINECQENGCYSKNKC